MKILFAVGSKGDPSYYASTINALLELGHRIMVLTEEGERGEKIESKIYQYWDGQVQQGKIHPRRNLVSKVIEVPRRLRTLSNYLQRTDQSPMYAERAFSTLQRYTRGSSTIRTIVLRLMKIPSSEKLLASIEYRFIPVIKKIKKQLSEINPDIIVITPGNLFVSPEMEYLKAGSALDIPTVLPVYSWDNLTTKGLIHVVPKMVLAWNAGHYEEAQQVHHVPSSNVIITGAQFFDKWFEDKSSWRVPREDYCQQVGLPSDAPYILYLGSSVAISGDEAWLVRELFSSLRADANTHRINMLVRPHPANIEHYLSFEPIEGLAIYPLTGALPGERGSQEDLYNALYHTFATIGVNTSGMIDAIINDKPVIALLTEAYAKSQSETQHFQHLLKADVLEIVNGVSSCPPIIYDLSQGLDKRQAQRQQFITDFVRPRGLETSAGELNAKVIEAVAQGKTKPEIEAILPTLLAKP